MALLEGEYWKRRLGSITNEYKKWREISRQQIKQTNDETPAEHRLVLLDTSQMHQFHNLPTSNSSYHLNNYSDGNNHQQQHFSHLNNNIEYLNNANNNSGYYNTGGTLTYNTNLNLPGNSSFSNSSFSSFNSNYHSSSQNLNTKGLGNNAAGHVSSNANYFHSPIAPKQTPYNNRCRSPSPGLFQDFDLYNFSSDTLFSTFCVEDPKEHSNWINTLKSLNNKIKVFKYFWLF